ncbi:MAG: hypothetical protein CL927_02335 [Deltaproteobacteria bacterium]|nr:hypothetical protein [Deltaproteobacteria bacterium]
MSDSFRVLSAMASLSLIGCKPPPDAPNTLESLAAYLFEHAADDDPDALKAGVENLDRWLDGNLAEARDGYTIHTLSTDAIDGVAVDPVHADGLVGAAVATTLPKGPMRVARALTMADPTKVFPDTFMVYERDWLDDPSCFVDRECGSTSLHAHTVSAYPMSLEVASDIKAEYRWVELDDGVAMVQRTWLRRPAEVSKDWVAVPAQFFLSVNLPQRGKTRRLQTTWIAAELGDTPVPEATALNMVIDSMVSSDEKLSEWMR